MEQVELVAIVELVETLVYRELPDAVELVVVAMP